MIQIKTVGDLYKLIKECERAQAMVDEVERDEKCKFLSQPEYGYYAIQEAREPRDALFEQHIEITAHLLP